MGISLKPEHLKRYKDIIRLFMKYGRGDLVKRQQIEEIFREDVPEAHGTVPRAEELAADLERMGPTFIKLGQLLSTRAELLPMEYLKALSRLQDDVEPFPFDQVEEIVTEELGVRLSKIFREFSPTPLAGASLGQVHAAVLRDGKPVAVKVQRPGIRRQIASDLEALAEVAQFLDKHTKHGENYEFEKMLEDFRRSLVQELDYRQEAQNLKSLGKSMRRFKRIVVPEVVDDYTTSRVLTMDFVRGQKITKLNPLARIEADTLTLADELFRAYLEQILVDGFFHADPHPGNVFFTDDYKIALIDLGMVGRVAPRLQEHLLKLLLAISEGRGEEVAEESIKIGTPKSNFQQYDFERRVVDLVNETQGARIQDLRMGTIVLEVTAISSECGIRVPPELTMLGKTLLNLDEVGRTLAPDFDPNAAIRRHAGEIMNRQLRRSLSPANLFSNLLEIKEMLETLPRSINRLLDNLGHNELRVKVDAIDEEYLMAGFQKIANRITVGVILAGMVVGASMLARVDTEFKLFGYPGLAIILFLFAAAGGVALVIEILFHDRGRHHKKE
jgi:ubiquinone biosynthesis protein